MIIKRLSTAVIESNFDWTIVKIEAENGICGYGEAFLGPGLPAVIHEFIPLLIGEDATSIERLMRRLRGVCIYASPGVVRHALSGIETPLSMPWARHTACPSGKCWAASSATRYPFMQTATPAKTCRASLRC